jgi:hypothetical protein
MGITSPVFCLTAELFRAEDSAVFRAVFGVGRAAFLRMFLVGGCSVLGSLSWFGRGSLPGTAAARRRARRMRLGSGAVVAGALLVALLPTQAVALPPPGGDRAEVNLVDLPAEDTATDAGTGVLDDLTGEATVPPVDYEPAHTTPPAGGTEDVPLSNPAAGDLKQAGTLPVLLGAPADATPEEASALDGTWRVEVADPAET